MIIPLSQRCHDCYEFGHEACGCGECGAAYCGRANEARVARLGWRFFWLAIATLAAVVILALPIW